MGNMALRFLGCLNSARLFEIPNSDANDPYGDHPNQGEEKESLGSKSFKLSFMNLIIFTVVRISHNISV